ncbi:MAG: bifunctional adenosylcobinamide kinase/adenosylcobinamide-phosphate guanylyltransferase [Lachnospiraceae bacterium]|nr:bifunctional adenosylcobinamide kinase/adenosylcobinamide-phosphate guanylyltransferase [Lachnospiraceae bacterium]
MMVLVVGGAASGKSAFAEELIMRAGEGHRLSYLATMERNTLSAEKRIERHRALRAGKGFETVECARDIRKVLQQCREYVLLECITNLLANEQFGETYVERVAEKIREDIRALKSRSRFLVLVSGDVFSDAEEYDSMTESYRRELGHLNCMLAEDADAVAEVSAGIPLWIKGGV